MDDLARVAERLILLNDYAQGLLAAVFNFKIRFDADTNKPKIMTDANLSTLFKAMTKRFPELSGITQLPGYSLFEVARKEIVDSLAEFYSTLVNLIDFKEAAFVCLLDCGRLVNLSPDWNTDVMELFLRLLISYVRVNVLVSLIGDRKIVTTVYSRAYLSVNSAEEPHYQRIAQYLTKFESPIEYMQQEFRPVSGRLGDVLLQLKTYYDHAYVKAEQLRHEGTLNVIALPQNIKKPSLEDKRLSYLGRSNEIIDWLIFGYLLCPSELNKPPAVDLMKAALQTGFLIEVYRGELFHVHAEFETFVSKNNSKAGKSMVSDATLAAVTGSGLMHFERRELLRLQLSQMLLLLKEKPGLCAPKFSLIVAALGMARDEVLWYFRHVDQASPSKKVKIKEEEYQDAAVSELMFLTDELKKHLVAHKQVVQNYYAEYLNVYYLKKLQTLRSNLAADVDETVRRHLDAAIGMLSSIKLNDPNTVSLEALRLNWARLQVHLSLPDTHVNASSYKDLIPLMGDISARSRYYDTVEDHINRMGGLESLLYYRQQLMILFSVATKNSNQSRFCSVYPSIILQFPLLISPYYPREAYPIGNKSTQMMDGVLTEIAKRIADLVHESAVKQVQFTRNGLASRAALAVREQRDAREGKQPVADKKNPQQSFKDTLPGKESRMRPDAQMKNLAQQQQIFKNLLCVIEKYQTITLFDQQFCPSQYLRDALTIHMNAFISSCVRTSSGDDVTQTTVKRPSVALVEIDAYLYALQMVESYIDLQLQTVIRNLLIDHIDMFRGFKASQKAAGLTNSPPMPKKQGRGAAPTAPAPSVDSAPVAFIYASWYCDFIVSRLQSNSFVISGNRRAIVSRPNMPFKTDHYFDFSELAALVQVIGPNGVRMLDQRILNSVRVLLADLKELVNVNREALDELSKSWMIEQRAAESLRKIRQVEMFSEKAVNLGTLLSFRSLLAGAEQHVLSGKIPHIFGCIDNAHAQYPANYFAVPGYSMIDTLANIVGIYRNVDTTLRASVSGLNREVSGDRRLFSYLPFMAAAALLTLSTSDGSAYNPILDAHENNAGAFAIAINRLIVSAMSTVCPAEEGEKEMATAQHNFVLVASTLLMRLDVSQQRPLQLDAAYLVLYKFVQESKFVTYDEFNNLLPYTIVRSAFSDAHKRIPKKKISKRAEDEMAF